MKSKKQNGWELSNITNTVLWPLASPHALQNQWFGDMGALKRYKTIGLENWELSNITSTLLWQLVSPQTLQKQWLGELGALKPCNILKILEQA